MKTLERTLLGPAPMIVLALLTLAGCSDEEPVNPNPSEAVDPVESAAAVDDVVASMDGNETLQSFNAAGPRFVQALGGGGASVPDRIDAPPLTQGLERLTLHALAVTERESMVHLAGVIPEEYWGVTFVLENGEYVPSERTGAPENGVRFILYALDPVTKQPLEDIEVGHADFIDESDETANRLRIVVVSQEITYVDYEVSCGFVVGGIEVTAVGFITDGEKQVNLDLLLAFSQSDGLSLDFHVEVPSENLGLDFEVSGVTPEGDDDTFSATYRVNRGSNEIVFELTAEAGALDGQVTINGAVVAVISGTLEDPVITDAEGNELGPEGRQALRRLILGAARAIDHLAHLLGPAFEICFLAN